MNKLKKMTQTIRKPFAMLVLAFLFFLLIPLPILTADHLIGELDETCLSNLKPLTDKNCILDGLPVNVYEFEVNVANSDSFVFNRLPKIIQNLDDGTWIILFESISKNNGIFLHFTIQNNSLHGQYKEYYPNGKLRNLRTYQFGKKSGIFALWTEEEQLISLSEFENSREVTDLNLNREGKVITTTNHYGKKPGTKIFNRPRNLKKEYRYLFDFAKSTPNLICED